MVLCKKCGADNPLGRVFCGSCGIRLDLSNLSSDDMAAKKSSIPLMKTLLPKILPVLVVLLALPVALAAWPHMQPLGKKGSKSGSQRVAGTLQAMTRIGRGASLGRDFTEADINGYFEFSKAKEMDAESVSIRVGQGYFTVRVVRIIGPLKLGSVQLRPRVSQELVCVPAGTRVQVASASVGHLTWLGPFRNSVASRIYRMVSAQPEWSVFQNLSEIRAEPEKLWIGVKKN